MKANETSALGRKQRKVKLEKFTPCSLLRLGIEWQ